MNLLNCEKIQENFKVNHHHTLDSIYNPITGIRSVCVSDARSFERLQCEVDDETYELIKRFFYVHDHPFAIRYAKNILEKPP